MKNKTNSQVTTIKWIKLQKYNVVLVDRQADRAIEIYHQIREEILRGDILGVQRLTDLKIDIKRRIREMDQFYNDNCIDQRVAYLQTPRMKLARLLLSDEPTKYEKSKLYVEEKKIEAPTMEEYYNLTSNNRKNNIPERNTERKEKTQKIDLSPKSTTRQTRKTELIPGKNVPKKLIMQQQNKHFSPLKPPKTFKKQQKLNKTPTKIKQAQNSRPSTQQNTKRESKLQKPDDSIKKLSQLIFTIKMTKKEYQDFRELKEKMSKTTMNA